MASKLPIEIWLMIAYEVGASDDLRSAWSWCRPICRSAKEATELAVCVKILPRLRLDILNNGEFTEKYGSEEPRKFQQAHFELAFQRVSADGSRAIFRPTQGSKINFGQLAFWEIEYHVGPGQLCEEKTMLFDWARTTQGDLLRDQWKKRLSLLAEAKPPPLGTQPAPLGTLPFQVYVTGTCAAPIPAQSDIDLNPEALEVSMSWRHLVGHYMREGEIIGGWLREAARVDEERRLRTRRELSRMEEALELALSSEPCRRLRFLKSLEDAADDRSTIRGIRYGGWPLQYHMELVAELDGKDPLKDDWMLAYRDDIRPQIKIPPKVAAQWYEEWKCHLLAGVPQT
ncbi:hypothetical protein SLS62_005033 [Diatrype stigma]|uniref:Uncharacterized protein n=1 Tax=Diatrype stigma TaxID=117547 RepID=A0AAN9V407_9PEZI